MKLSQRLQYLIDDIAIDESVIDVAADHGYASLALKLQNQHRQIIVSDVAQEPLNAAKKNFAALGVDADFRLGNGLSVLDDHECIDVVIIAGVGGKLITTILAEAMDREIQMPKLRLQANNGMVLVRAWLWEHNYAVIEECLIEDGKYIYECIRAEYIGVKDSQYHVESYRRQWQYRFGVLLEQQSPLIYQKWLQLIITDCVAKIEQLSQAVQQAHVTDKVAYYQAMLTYAQNREENYNGSSSKASY